jgi:hypothetical protein
MIDHNGQAGMVDADKVQAATANGFKPAVKMLGPNGDAGYVSEDKVSAARQNNFAVHADNPGVQRMATPEGQLTYALPSEVNAFKASGHVPIDDSGNFRVDPLEGEDNTDTMARAAKIAKNLPPEVMKQAIAAEQKTHTAKRIAANLVAAPLVIGAAAPVALAAPGIAADAAAAANATPAAISAGRAIGTAAGSPLGQFVIKEGGKYLLRAAATAGLGTVAGLAWKWANK